MTTEQFSTTQKEPASSSVVGKRERTREESLAIYERLMKMTPEEMVRPLTPEQEAKCVVWTSEHPTMAEFFGPEGIAEEAILARPGQPLKNS